MRFKQVLKCRWCRCSLDVQNPEVLVRMSLLFGSHCDFVICIVLVNFEQI